MNMNLDLEETTKRLMSLDPEADYTDEELEQYDDLSDELIRQYSWPEVYKTWSNYLYTQCPDEQDVIWFAHNFFAYSPDSSIPDPVHFTAYLYYRVDTSLNEDAYQIFDSVAIKVLENSGVINMMNTPLWTAETDPRIQAEISVLKSRR